MAVGNFVTNADNPGVGPVNLSMVIKFAGVAGNKIKFDTPSGSIFWQFSTPTHATTAFLNLETLVGTTAVAD